jgi:hypothetical protein
MHAEYVRWPRCGFKTEGKYRDYDEDTDTYDWYCECGAFV